MMNQSLTSTENTNRVMKNSINLFRSSYPTLGLFNLLFPNFRSELRLLRVLKQRVTGTN